MSQNDLNVDPTNHLPPPPNPNPTMTSDELPEAILSLAQGMLLSKPASSPVTLSDLVHYLPPVERGWTLLEAFFENAAWFYSPLKREAFIEGIFSFFYGRNSNSNSNGNGNGGSQPTPGPSELSILFMVLTIGSLVDLTSPLPSASHSADTFYSLAKASLVLDAPLDSGQGCTTTFVQAVTMMVCYSCQWSAKSMEVEKVWCYVGLGTRLALSVSRFVLGLLSNPSSLTLFFSSLFTPLLLPPPLLFFLPFPLTQFTPFISFSLSLFPLLRSLTSLRSSRSRSRTHSSASTETHPSSPSHPPRPTSDHTHSGNSSR